jgi:hypothetical protein
MGIHRYYQFLDRDKVDPLLAMTWRQLLRRYRGWEDEIEELIAFAVDPEPDAAQVRAIIERRTLRWTLQRSSPQYHLLAEILAYARVNDKCPYVECPAWEHPLLLAVAAEAFLANKIDRRTLYAVLRISAISFPTDWLDIASSDERILARGWDPDEMARPIYPWQGAAAHLGSDGDTALGIVDTRRLVRFVLRAWNEDWPAPRLLAESLKGRLKKRRGLPRFRDFDRFRDFELAGNLHDALAGWQVRRPSVFRRCE